jgi:DNA invertase Pin-like site-specific DNA recombinase
MRAAAYLRKSKSDDPTREVSRDVQEDAVRRLAEADGLTIDPSRLYVDWDRSADEAKSSRRVAFRRLIRDIEAGDIDVVYAFAADRLYRSLEAYSSLMSAADKSGTRIVTPSGAINGDGSPAAEFAGGLGALLARMELSTAKQRAKAAYAMRLARDGKANVGQAPYGKKLERQPDGRVIRVDDPDRPVAPIIDAFIRAGRKPRAAAKILNDELKIAAPYGGHWDRTSIIRIINRERPDLMPPKGPTGRREAPPSPALLAKLLRCHCGRLLTPNRHVERRPGRPAGTSVSYYCARGNAEPKTHGKPYYVAESVVLPFVKAEADRLRPPEAVRMAEDREAERTAIADDRRKLVTAWRAGAIGEDEWKAADAEAVKRLEALDAEARVTILPAAIDWTWPTENINEVLRSFIDYVQLDRNLRPTSAVWTLPEWRATIQP